MGEITNATVCLLGMGTVFFGLIMIVFFCKLMSAIIQRYDRDSSPDKPQQTAPVTAVPEVPAPIPENLEIAVSAALSEMLNTDLSNIRISSWREYQETEIPNRQEVVAERGWFWVPWITITGKQAFWRKQKKEAA